jgi:hypothetical protein
MLSNGATCVALVMFMALHPLSFELGKRAARDALFALKRVWRRCLN